MTPQQIINEAIIPRTRSVLVLGSFEKRVTVYAQQVRALNLVDALLSESLVRPQGGKIAIIGGGAAGITAAVALARTTPGLAALDLFERSSSAVQVCLPCSTEAGDFFIHTSTIGPRRDRTSKSPACLS
jgi:hypothetical protein